MLTSQELTELRNSVEAIQRRGRAATQRWARFIDGPLVGLLTAIEVGLYENPDAILGWCKLTSQGAVVPYYKQSGVPGEWRFDRFELPGQRESGLKP